MFSFMSHVHQMYADTFVFCFSQHTRMSIYVS